YPFLRLYLFVPGERLRARNVTLSAVLACFVAAGLTLILADIYFWNSFFGPAAEQDMLRLAHAIDTNFQREQRAALTALEEMNLSDELRTKLQKSEWPPKGDVRV